MTSSRYRIAQPSVPELVQLVRDANYLVTDSFCRTTFSVNCEFPFTVVRFHKYAEQASTTLNATNPSSWMVRNVSDVDSDIIKWERARNNGNELRERSQGFLQTALEYGA